MAQEGQVAIGPNGERAVFRGGQWVVTPNAPPADPKFQYEGPKAAADVQKAQADTVRTQVQARVDEQTAPTTVQTNQAPAGTMWIDPSNPELGVKPIPGWTPPPNPTQIEQDNKAAGLSKRAQIIRDQIKVVRGLYEKNFKGQPSSRLFGLTEKIDSLPNNEEFRVAAETILPLIRPLVAQTAREGDSDREMQIFMSYIPSNDDSDQTVERKLKSLEGLVDGMVGGSPPSASIDKQGNVRAAAGRGATQTSDPAPDGYQEAIDQFFSSGNFTPELYATTRLGLDQKYGRQSSPDAYYQYLEEGYQLGEAMKQGREVNTQVPPTPRDLSSLEQMWNNAASSPTGTAIANYADSAGFGLPSMMLGDQANAMNDLNPTAAMIGQIGGAVTGTAGLGKMAGMTAGRYIPKLMGGGAKGQFARNLLTDATYSGIYGATTGEDPAQSAILGAVGSAGGQIAGKGLGKVIDGANLDPAVEYLRSRNIPLTTGQTLGGWAKSAEDRMSSMPLIGDMVNARRMEGLDAFNRQALSDAGSPIAFSPKEIGKEGIQELIDATSDAYSGATSGTTVPLDPQFNADMRNVAGLRQMLPEDYAVRFDKVGQNRIAPIVDAGQMTGETYQQAVRGIKGARSQASGAAPGFEGEYKDALSAAQRALTDQMLRSGGDDVVAGLGRADQAYRLGKTVENAAYRADGNNYIFTPSQLQDAVKATGRKYPGNNPLSNLADQAQQVLPSRIPDSGTAGRIAQMALPASIAGGGAGLGYVAGGGEGAQTGAATSGALATALLLLGTKRGQRALNAAIADRNNGVKVVSNAAKRRMGLFGGPSGFAGSATIPFMVNNQ